MKLLTLLTLLALLAVPAMADSYPVYQVSGSFVMLGNNNIYEQGTFSFDVTYVAVTHGPFMLPTGLYSLEGVPGTSTITSSGPLILTPAGCCSTYGGIYNGVTYDWAAISDTVSPPHSSGDEIDLYLIYRVTSVAAPTLNTGGNLYSCLSEACFTNFADQYGETNSTPVIVYGESVKLARTAEPSALVLLLAGVLFCCLGGAMRLKSWPMAQHSNT